MPIPRERLDYLASNKRPADGPGMGHWESIDLAQECLTFRRWMAHCLDLVNKQAEDEGLWCPTTNIHEAYVQQELRKLHWVVETGGGPDVDIERTGLRASGNEEAQRTEEST